MGTPHFHGQLVRQKIGVVDLQISWKQDICRKLSWPDGFRLGLFLIVEMRILRVSHKLFLLTTFIKLIFFLVRSIFFENIAVEYRRWAKGPLFYWIYLGLIS